MGHSLLHAGMVKGMDEGRFVCVIIRWWDGKGYLALGSIGYLNDESGRGAVKGFAP